MNTKPTPETERQSAVPCSAWLERLTLFKHPDGPDGKVLSTWNVVGWVGRKSSWTLSWHKHVKSCRYGLYTNLRCRGGLVACLNLPILGDWAVWRGVGRSNDPLQRRADGNLSKTEPMP